MENQGGAVRYKKDGEALFYNRFSSECKTKIKIKFVKRDLNFKKQRNILKKAKRKRKSRKKEGGVICGIL